MKIVSIGLKEHATNIKNYEIKEMTPLNYKKCKFYKKQKVCYICKRESNTCKDDKNAFNPYHKVRNHCHYTGKYIGVVHDIYISRYKIPNKFLWYFIMVLHMTIIL